MTIPRTQGRGVSLICPRKGHQGCWSQGAPPLDRLTDGSGWACPGIMADGSPCGYERRHGTAAGGASDSGPPDELEQLRRNWHADRDKLVAIRKLADCLGERNFVSVQRLLYEILDGQESGDH